MKKHQNLTVLFLSIFCFAHSVCRGQDIESIGKGIRTRVQQRDLFRLNGRLYANLKVNDTYGIPARADPFSLRFNVQLNFDFLGIKAPFSAAFSDGDPTFNYPAYAFCGSSPAYKWATLHLGDRVMDFSPYTLSGHHFFGTGVEVKPGIFYFAAFQGRLRRARPEDAGKLQQLDPVYKRTGWGFKTGINDGSNSINLIVFSARDDPGSLLISDTLSPVSPEANVVVGLQARRQIGKKLDIDLDWARSALTRDVRQPGLSRRPSVLLSEMAGLFSPNATSGYHNALKAGLRLKPRFGEFKVQYERIDPGYRSLGALFFNNDLENLTMGGKISLFRKKAFLSANSGLQRNLSGHNNPDAMSRFIGSIDLSVNPGSRLSIGLSLSNFSTTNRFTVIRTPFVDLDSIILVQSNSSASLAATYLGPNQQSVWTLAGSYQHANAIEADRIRSDLSHSFFTAVISHILTSRSGRWQLGSSCMANYSAGNQTRSLTVGPGLTFSKTLGDGKWRIQSTASHSLVFNRAELINQVLNLQLNSCFLPDKKQGLEFSLFFTRAREGPGSPLPTGFREWNFSLAYTYRLF